jgi:hypothetical protein
MTKEGATRHYEEHQYDFALSSDTGNAYVYCSTRVAKEFSDALAACGSTIDIEACHPEFLGWTVEEIMEHGK